MQAPTPSCFSAPEAPRQVRYLAHIHRCDPPADALAAAISGGRVSRADFEAALTSHSATDAVLADFLAAITPPLWVNPQRARVGCEALQRTE